MDLTPTTSAKTIPELLDSPQKWTRGSFARDTEGKTVAIHGPKAVCWCLVGATARVYPLDGLSRGTAMDKLRVHLKLKDSESLSAWNDNHTYEEVIAACKAAGV